MEIRLWGLQTVNTREASRRARHAPNSFRGSAAHIPRLKDSNNGIRTKQSSPEFRTSAIRDTLACLLPARM